MKNVSFIFFLPLWVFLTSITFAADFQAKVIHIADGDTITVLNDANKQIKIRLNGIDCPKKRQAFGNKAKQFASELVFGKTVTVGDHGKDRYGRTIGAVVLPDGTNVKHELVKAGMCWWYRKYAPNDKLLAQAEEEARLAKRGLWVDPSAVPPWEWRKARKRYR